MEIQFIIVVVWTESWRVKGKTSKTSWDTNHQRLTHFTLIATQPVLCEFGSSTEYKWTLSTQCVSSTGHKQTNHTVNDKKTIKRMPFHPHADRVLYPWALHSREACHSTDSVKQRGVTKLSYDVSAHLADTSLLLLWTSDCTCCISHSLGGSACLLPGKQRAGK